MKKIAYVGIFFGIFCVFILTVELIFPTDPETNTILVPGWYASLAMLTSIGGTIVISRQIKKRKKKKAAQRLNVGGKASQIKFIPTRYSDLDPDLFDVVDVIFDSGTVSATAIQKKLGCGYSRAYQIICQLSDLGIISNSTDIALRSPIVRKHIAETILKSAGLSRTPHVSNLTQAPLEPEISINTSNIIALEEKWRRGQSGLSIVEYELSKIDGMDGHLFEHWCADLLLGNGFCDVKVTPGSNDQGVDILAKKDGVTYAIQCKRYSSDLGNTPVQEVAAGRAIYGCHVAVVMTNQHFTSSAKVAASATNVLLWDRDRLTQMIETSIHASQKGNENGQTENS